MGSYLPLEFINLEKKKKRREFGPNFVLTEVTKIDIDTEEGGRKVDPFHLN